MKTSKPPTSGEVLFGRAALVCHHCGAADTLTPKPAPNDVTGERDEDGIIILAHLICSACGGEARSRAFFPEGVWEELSARWAEEVEDGEE